MSAKNLEALLRAMSLEEKVSLLSGADMWRTRSLERHGVPQVKLSDGPNGVRGETFFENTSSCFPVGVALAASWNPSLIQDVARAIGLEARDKDVSLVLGPTINLHRTPIGGRNFECYSEDPILTAHLARAFVNGIQSQGVGACLKHYVANDTEFERHTIDSQVADRPLRELYLLPFEMAVKSARPWSVMSSYNRINGVYGSSHDFLVNGVLKGEWGFDGFVVSDWGAALETTKNALGGLDLEMPGPGSVWGAKLIAAVEDGAVPESVIDDKVTRLLRFFERAGRLGGPDLGRERTVDRPEHRTIARRAAQEAMVLLKNDGVLPLDKTRVKRLAVIGPNAEKGQIQGGGSSGVRPLTQSHPLGALTEALGPSVDIVYEPGCLTHKYLPLIDVARLTPLKGEGEGWYCEYFDTEDLSRPPRTTKIEERSNITHFGDLPKAPGTPLMGMRLSARFTATETGPHAFGIASAGLSKLLIDGEEIIDNWESWERGETFFSFGSTEKTGVKDLMAGQTYTIVFEFLSRFGGFFTGLRIGMLAPMPDDLMDRAIAAAKSADAVILVLGTNSDWETEGNDRADMGLPGDQDALAEAVLAANPNTVVVVNAGSPVDMPWNDKARSILYTWFAGQEYGHALSDILFGAVEPTGRLPITIPRRLEDTPAYTAYPGEGGVMPYAEGLFIGYRWYDERAIAPLYPFGHGLGYGESAITSVSAPSMVKRGTPVEVEVTVSNDGPRATTAVVQIYVAPQGPRLRRPPKELKGFSKISLAPGKQARVRVSLSERDFSYWDPHVNAWVCDAGSYEILAGFSATDIKGGAAITIEE